MAAVRAAPLAPHADRLRRARLERAGHGQPRAPDDGARPTPRAPSVLVDGAQAAPHLAVDVRAIGCDFYAFSGHKVYGPSGVGALYGQAALLEAMPPWQGGGDMIALGHLREDHLERAALQVRGGHPEHRRGDRARGRASTGWRGSASTRSPRTRTTCCATGRRPAGGDPGPADRRHRAGEGGRPLLRSRRRPPPRRGHDPRPRGDRGPHRPPLRPAGHGPLRHPGHRAGLARLLQHARGARRARARRPQGAGDVR